MILVSPSRKHQGQSINTGHVFCNIIFSKFDRSNFFHATQNFGKFFSFNVERVAQIHIKLEKD